MTDLKDKVALVTGASGGIGSTIAIALAQQGLCVIGTGSSEQSATKVKELFKEHNLSGHSKVLDIAKISDIERVIAEIKTEFGAVEILINNAGVTSDNLMLRMKDTEWHKVIQTDLDSVFHLSKACLRDMVKARWGRIVNISSIVGVSGNPGQANYAAAKAGMIGFSKSLAQEVASRGITVNCIAPGFIDTPMTQKLSDEQRNMLQQRIPMNRLGEPQDIAYTVSFLISPAASYITGQTIHVNGGMLMV